MRVVRKDWAKAAVGGLRRSVWEFAQDVGSERRVEMKGWSEGVRAR